MGQLQDLLESQSNNEEIAERYIPGLTDRKNSSPNSFDSDYDFDKNDFVEKKVQLSYVDHL